jgi:tetratricopeptide (TPR) repeat protein
MGVGLSRIRARVIRAAVMAWITPWHDALSQTPQSSAPASCVAPATQRTTNEQGGVVVRFATAPGAKPFDVLTGSALAARLADALSAILETSVRAGVTARDSLDPAVLHQESLRALSADDRWLITGDVSSTADVVTVTWRVVDARSGREVSTGRARDSLIWLPRLTGALLGAVGGQVGADRSALVRAAASMQHRATTSRQAIDPYLGGLFELTAFGARSYKVAIERFRTALTMDSTFVDAYLGLATAQLRIVEWGDSVSARGRDPRLASAKDAVNRALALDPNSVRALSLLAQVHLARDEPVVAGIAVAALRQRGARPGDIAWLEAEVHRAQGDSLAARRIITDAGARIWGHVPGLFLRAELERRQGRSQLACMTLSRILRIDPAWGPAYVMRALVRANLGDRRGGWADAELAARLGRPEWGAAATALIDISMGDARTVRPRARQLLNVEPDATLPWMDALLRAAVFHALGDAPRARAAIAAMPCRDDHRRMLAGDPLLRALRIPTECRVSRRPVSTG